MAVGMAIKQPSRQLVVAWRDKESIFLFARQAAKASSSRGWHSARHARVACPARRAVLGRDVRRSANDGARPLYQARVYRRQLMLYFFYVARRHCRHEHGCLAAIYH